MKPSMRLDKMLAHEGYGTRSDIKRLVREGAVTVNGRQAVDPGMHVRPAEDEVCVFGQAVAYREFRYVMLHKPAGVVSATEDAREPTVLGLLPDEMRRHGLFPVGRLDKDAEGLLLLTNDGKLAHGLLSPRKAVFKTYRALVRGTVDAADAEAFAAGVTLDDGYVTMPARLTVLAALPAPDLAGDAPVSGEEAVRDMRQAAHRLAEEPGFHRRDWEEAVRDGARVSWVELAIREGKFHQVKRMFAAVGKKVLYLQRVAVGDLRLDPALGPGGWRELTPEEEESLRANRGEA